MLSVTLAEMRSYSEAIARLSSLLSLVSLVPVMSELRFSKLRYHTPQRQSERRAAAPVSRMATVGMLSVFLLLTSEVVGVHELFIAVPAKAASKASAKTPGMAGAFITAAKKGVTSIGTSAGITDRIKTFVSALLDPTDSFAATHGLVMIVGLVTILGHVSNRTVSQCLDQRGWRATGVRVFSFFMSVALVGLFIGGHWEALTKTWKAIAIEKLVHALQLTLRVAALLVAVVPHEGDQGSTPATFVAFQVASLTASLSSEISSGSIATAMHEAKQSAITAALVDNKLVAVVFPMLLAILWLCAMHLHTKAGPLILAMLLSIVTSPAVVAVGWPKIAKEFGKPDMLIKVASIVYALSTLTLFISGGAVCLLGAMVVGHAFVGIHGLEAFGLAGAA